SAPTTKHTEMSGSPKRSQSSPLSFVGFIETDFIRTSQSTSGSYPQVPVNKSQVSKFSHTTHWSPARLPHASGPRLSSSMHVSSMQQPRQVSSHDFCGSASPSPSPSPELPPEVASPSPSPAE